MGLFNRDREEPPSGRSSRADWMAVAQQKRAQAMQLSAQLTGMDVEAMQRAAAAVRQGAASGRAADGATAHGGAAHGASGG
jgi:hypothetical protein